MAIILVGPSGDYTDLAAAVAGATAGDIIQVAAGTYVLTSTLNLDKALTIVGAGEGDVTIDASGVSGYGILVTGDDVSLSDFSLLGPTANASASYGIKVQPDTGNAGDLLHNFSLSDVTVSGSGKSEIDLNGVDGATLTHVTANGLGTAGQGIALTDSSNVTLTDIATSGNNWGSVVLNSSNRYYDHATGNITFTGSYNATEVVKIFADDASNGISGDGNNEVNGTSTNLGPLTLPASFAENHGYQVQFAPGAAVSQTYYFATETEAATFLGTLSAPQKALALLEDPDGNWLVKNGMSVQMAVNAADAGDTISIYAGTYVESGYPAGQSGDPGGLYINKAGLTLQGVDASGNPITDAATAQASGPTIIAGHQTGFGASHWLDKDADNVTLTGIHWQAGLETNNKVLEVWGDNVTIQDNFIDRINQANEDTFAAAIYLNGDGTTLEDWITAYKIADNILNEGIIVSNGVGDPSGGVSPVQLITGNSFLDSYDYDTGLGRYDTIVLNGQVPTVGWLLEPVQIPTVSGNDFGPGGVPFVLRGSDANTDNLPNLSEVQAILAANSVARFAYVVDPLTGDLRYATTTTGEGDIHRFAVTNTLDTLNLALDSGYDNVFFGAQRDYIHQGDTVVIQSGSAPLDNTVAVEGLTIKALAGSADLNLTLGTTLPDGTPIAGGGITQVTLSNYAPGAGANVDVTGNGLANIITGNSGANAINGADGNDTLNGGGGVDSIDGGDGIDTAVYSDAVTVASSGGNWVVTSAADGTESLADVEVVQDSAPGNTLLVGNGGFATIQEAINASSAGDTILVAAGVYDEDLVINKAVRILGVQSGVAGSNGGRDAAGGAGETTIIGESQITTSGDVTLDGLRFLNNGTTTGGAEVSPTLKLTAASAGGTHVITNSVFWSTVTGGGADDRAISAEVIGSGSIVITDNLISGTSTGGFSTASWGRGLWFDGGGVDLSASGNVFQSTRTGMNLDVSGSSDISVTGNSFTNAGTGISGGINAGGVLDGITDNDFANVGTEFNLRNLTTGFTFDAEVAVDTLTTVGPDNNVLVLGGTGADSISGTSGADALVGNGLNANTDADTLDGRGGNDTLLGGGGNDLLTGGAGNDSIDGGADTDTLVLTGNRLDYTFSGAATVTVTDTRGGSPDGVDTVANVEFVQFADRILTMDALVNNTAPTDIAFTGAVDENSASGTVVGTATATDGQISGGDSVTFTLTDNAGGLFSINGTTGVVTLVGAVDAETALGHSITIRATDSGGLTRDESFTVTVNDLDEFNVTAPVDTDGAANAVAENSIAGSVVHIDVSAADADATTSAVTFSLFNNAGGRFQIDANTGVVTTTQALDFEAAASYGIIVRASSADGSTADTGFTVNVTNVAEAPMITSSGGGASASIDVIEGTALVVDNNAIDPDGTTPTWSLSGADAALFTINGAGVLSFLTAPNFEAPADVGLDNVYNVTVTASDGVLTDTQDLTVNVLNLAETITLSLTTGPDGYTALSNDNYVIDGLAGNDTISTAGGADVVFGNAGDDVINTGAGNDVMTFSGTSGGFDQLDGGAGLDDRINALATNTVIGLKSIANIETISSNGHTGVKILGSALGDNLDFSSVSLVGITQISLGAGNDTAIGSSIADTFQGGKGDDSLNGGGGDDVFLVGPSEGFDAVNGGSGSDTIKALADNVIIGLSALSGVEVISANGKLNVTISGSANGDLLDFSTVSLSGITAISGGSGNDSITGTGGGDTIIGGAGNDVLSGGGGNDLFRVGAGAGTDAIDGGSGSDTIAATAVGTLISFGSWTGVEVITADGFANVQIVGSAASEVIDLSSYVLNGIAMIDGGAGNDLITGSAGADTISGGNDTDTLMGGAGNDVLIFGNGADVFDGGANVDTLLAAANNSTLTWSAGTITGIEVISGGSFTGVKILGTNAGEAIDLSALTLTGISAIDAGKGNDTVTGSGDADTIIGGAGNDLLSGGSGDDLFLFGANAGREVIHGGSGLDIIRAAQSGVTLTWGTYDGVEAVEGGGFSNVRIGGTTGSDAIDLSAYAVSGIAAVEGGNGNDVITGSSGSDTIVGGAGADTLTGGGGADVFDFNLASESNGVNIDRITDFTQGSDLVDLASIDADAIAASDQAFAFIGAAAFTGVAGQLRFDTGTIAGVTRIIGDTNGDMVADLEIRLVGTLALTAADFAL